MTTKLAHSYRYVRFQTSNGVGYGCFSFTWDRDAKEFNYKLSASFCSPKEHNFRKHQAREMADVRLRKENKFMTGSLMNVSPQKGLTNKDFAEMLKLVSLQLEIFPRWAQKALSKGNIKFGLSLKNDK